MRLPGGRRQENFIALRGSAAAVLGLVAGSQIQSLRRAECGSMDRRGRVTVFVRACLCFLRATTGDLVQAS